MLTAIILICSLAITPNLSDCNTDNAVSVTSIEEPSGNPVMCFMHGQAYIAETEIGRNLTKDERVKVVCAQKR